MKTSRDGIELIKRWEGCRLKAYPDPATNGEPYTIGYGLTSAAGIVPVVKGMTITQQQADDYLVQSLVKYEAAVMKALTRSPSQPQFDAMTSLCYNIGPGSFAKSSVVKKFNKGDIPGAADAFLLWNKAGGKVMQGLVNRREAERAMFLRAAPVAPEKPVEPVAPPPAPIPTPEPEAPVAPPKAPETPAQNIAKWLIAAVGGLVAILAAWLMKG